MTAFVMLAVAFAADPSPVVVELWPAGKIPGPVSTEPSNVPTLTIRLASKDKANGTTIVVCPGGGYSGRAIDHEGKQIAEWLNERGVHVFILKYRTVAEGKVAAPLEPGPMLDVQRAIRTVRAKARDHGVDPARIGVWGFSAGGHLASTAATPFDAGKTVGIDDIEKISCRPDFAILAYPVITMGEKTHGGSKRNLLGDKPDPKKVEFYSSEKQVTDKTPPIFLFHTEEDKVVPIENARLFKAACDKAGVPCELVVMEKGVHGIGLGGSRAKGLPAEKWPEKLEAWLAKQGLLGKK